MITKNQVKLTERPLHIAMAEVGLARQLPAGLVDVALIDAPTCAAAGDMSLSWWYSEVAAGRAPAAVVRRVRHTRWRLTDVRDFWAAFAQNAAADAKSIELLTARAKTASTAAAAKRAAVAAAAAVE